MPISKSQLDDRKNHLGSSDLAAIVGLDPWRSAYDVYLDKTGKLEEQEETKVMVRGNLLETPILDWFSMITERPIIRNQKRSAKKRGIPIAVNCDALCADGTNEPVEAKSQGAYSNEVWGEEGTDQLPDRVIVQCHAQLICTGADVVHVPAYLAYREFQLFIVKKNKDLMDMLIEKATDFWEAKIQQDIPPEGTPSISVVSRVIRTPNKIVDIDPALIHAYKNAQVEASAAAKAQKEAKASLLAALGDAEGGKAGDLNITYFEHERKGYTVQPSTYRKIAFPKTL